VRDPFEILYIQTMLAAMVRSSPRASWFEKIRRVVLVGLATRPNHGVRFIK